MGQFQCWNPEGPNLQSIQTLKHKWVIHAIDCIREETSRDDFIALGNNVGAHRLLGGLGKHGRDASRLNPDLDVELKFSLTRIQVALQTISQLIFSGLDGGSYEAQLAEIIKNLIHILFSCSASYTHHYASYTHWPGESLK